MDSKVASKVIHVEFQAPQRSYYCQLSVYGYSLLANCDHQKSFCPLCYPQMPKVRLRLFECSTLQTNTVQLSMKYCS